MPGDLRFVRRGTVEQGGCAVRCERWEVARPVGGRCTRGAGVWGPRGPQVTRRLPVYLGEEMRSAELNAESAAEMIRHGRCYPGRVVAGRVTKPGAQLLGELIGQLAERLL